MSTYTPTQFDELLSIIDARAGREHSRDGAVAQTLREVLDRYEETRKQSFTPTDEQLGHARSWIAEAKSPHNMYAQDLTALAHVGVILGHAEMDGAEKTIQFARAILQALKESR